MALGGSIAGTAKVILSADTASFDRGMSQARGRFHGHVEGIEKDSERMSRGVLAGSGAFTHLGRSIAFASGTFLGAAGFTAVIRASVGAAETLEKAHRGLEAQIRASGGSAESAQPAIAAMDSRMARLGHTSVETEGALSRLVRATGNVHDGLQLMGLAADLAAARHISLEQAALLVGKVFDGNVAALNRYGIHIAKGTSVTDALAQAQRVLAGQAQASVTPMERLHATVGNLQATLGTQLLPTLNHISSALADWLGKSQNQERVQKDLSETLRVAGGIVHGVAGAFGVLTTITGGAKNAVELLGGAFVGLKLAGLAKSLGLVGNGIFALGAKSSVSAGEVGLLSTRLKALAGIGTIVVGVDLLFTANGHKILTSHLNLIGPTGNWALDKALQEVGLQKKGGGTQDSSGAPGSSGSAPQTGTRQKNQRAAIVAVAQTQLGISYQWGGPAILGQHTDCSGLAQAVLAKNGIHVGRTTYDQWKQGHLVTQPQPGDLVFFHMGPRGPEHVGVYIGNDQFIEDPHTGASVRISKLSSYPGFVGARSYVTASASNGTRWQNNPNDASKPGAFTPIPKSLRLAYAEATVTKGNTDDLRVLHQIDDYLKERLKVEKNKDHRIALLDAQKSTEDSIKSLSKPKSPGAFDPVPARFRLALAEAGITKSNADDIRVLKKIDDYLRDRLKHTRNIDQKIAILDELSSNQQRIVDLTKPKKKPHKQAAIFNPTDAEKGIPQIPGLSDAISEFTNLTSGQGTIRISIPGVGKVLTPYSLQPTVAAWNQVIKDLKKKLTAANARRAALNRSLTKAMHAKIKNRSLISYLRGQIGKIDGVISTLKDDIGLAVGEVLQLATDAEAKAQQDADEAEKTAKADAEAADSAAESGASSAPVGLEQQIANSILNGDVQGQVDAVRKEEAFFQNELDTGVVVTEDGRTIALTPEARLAVTNSLIAAKSSEKSLLQQIADNTATTADAAKEQVAFFEGLRNLRGFEGNILSSAIGGSAITVTNYFPVAPTDPHTFSAGIAFDLKALVNG